MKLSLYRSFKDTIETIPARAIRRVLEREQLMLAEDLAHQRPLPIDDAGSILNFCLFVESVGAGVAGHEFASAIPPKHRHFYRQTLLRLVEADELPAKAISEFDRSSAHDDTSLLIHNN